MVKHFPTPYPGVNKVLNLLLRETQKVLGPQFVGMVLYGSLSSGDFDPASSDIDFLVITADLLDEQTINVLGEMHSRIWDSGLKWAAKLEGSYLPRGDLPRYEKTGVGYPTVNEGKFYVAPHGSDWIIQRHIIRDEGLVLAGPNPKTMIDLVSPEEIRGAVTGILREWWFPMLDNPDWLKERGKEYYAYAILTMCRSLHALEHGTIVSKPAAANWTQQELGGKWSQVIKEALVMQSGEENFNLYNHALELIRYTMERIES